MADGDVTLRIDEALADRLRLAAEAAGQSLEAYARQALEAFSNADDWDEVDRICDETIARGDGVPLDEVRPWLKGWGKPEGPPRPR